MKKIIIICLIALATLPLRAQEFQWANKFTGESEIVNLETDSQGNIYVLGFSTRMASYQGVMLGNGNRRTTFILKLDPQGNLLWKKQVYRTNNDVLHPHFMRLVGDSCLVAMFPLTLPDWNNGLYYLDTLIPRYRNDGDYGGYPFPEDGLTEPRGTAMAVLDLDGNLKSHHFLKMVTKDENNEIMLYPGENVAPTVEGAFLTSPFWVDNDGFVYLASDYSKSIYDTNYYGWVIDGRLVCSDKSPVTGPHSPLLLKLTPEMDSVVWCKSIIQSVELGGSCRKVEGLNAMPIRGLVGDGDGGIYVSLSLDYIAQGTFAREPDNTWHEYDEFVDPEWRADLILDANDTSKRIRLKFNHTAEGFLVKYSADGTLMWCKQLERKPVHTMRLPHSASAYLENALYNPSTNSLFVTVDFMNGNGGDTTQYWSFILDETTHALTPYNHHAGFIEFNCADGTIRSHGIAPSTRSTRMGVGKGLPSLAIRNNQVFTQLRYTGTMTTFDSELEGNDTPGLVFVRFHQDGHAIDAIDYNAHSPSNIGTAICFAPNGDLILTGTTSNASTTMGTLPVGDGTFIAKLSDPTFNAPYTPEPREQSILWEQELNLPLAAAAIPLTARATSGLPVAYTVEDPTVARLSHDTLLLLAPGSTNIYADQPGDLWWIPAPQQARTLTVTTTPDPNAITPVAPEEVLSVEYFDLLGRRSKVNFHSLPRGIYLERTVTTHGVTTRKTIL